MNYYNEIKNKLIDNEITKRIKDYNKNRSDLNTYYNVWKLLSEAGKHYVWRIKVIYEEWSKNIEIEQINFFSIRIYTVATIGI